MRAREILMALWLSGGLLAAGRAAPAARGAAVIERWPEAARAAAQAMLDEYGEPEVVSDEALVWRGNGPWKRTVALKAEAEHRFPLPHKDVLIQTINYRVPPDKVDDLARLDGSLIVDRTRGELSSGCGSEAANFLALNLANDVVQGLRTVEQAREELARTLASRPAGKESKRLDRLLFAVANDGTGDPDEAVLTEGKTSEGSPSERLQEEEPPETEGPSR